MMAGEKKKRKNNLGSKWTKADVERLRRLFPLRQNDDLEQRFGRSYGAIKKKAQELGLKKSINYRTEHSHPYKRWTPFDIRRLKRLYPTELNRDIAKRLKRTELAIMGKATELGLWKKYGRGCGHWKKQELCFLQTNYFTMDFEAIVKKLGRPYHVVRTRATLLGLSRRKFWTQKEDALLTRLYPHTKVNDVATKLGRPVSGVYARARTLGLQCSGKRRALHWSKKEDALLTKMYPHHQANDIATKLGIPVSRVYVRASQLGLCSRMCWTEKEDAWLTKKFPRGNMNDIAEKLGRTVSGVRRRAQKIGLRRAEQNNTPQWSEKEIRELNRLYPALLFREISERMGRPISTIYVQLKRQGLVESNRWTDEEVQILKQYYPHRPSREIADMLGISVQPVMQKASRMGIYKTKMYRRSIRFGKKFKIT